MLWFASRSFTRVAVPTKWPFLPKPEVPVTVLSGSHSKFLYNSTSSVAQCRAEVHRWVSRIATRTTYTLKQVFTTRKKTPLIKNIRKSQTSYKLNAPKRRYQEVTATLILSILLYLFIHLIPSLTKCKTTAVSSAQYLSNTFLQYL